jgi:ribonuclease P protein component
MVEVLVSSLLPFILYLKLYPFLLLVVSLTMVRYTLSKQERLCSLKAIERLFTEGQSLAKYPVRLVWKELRGEESQEFPVKVMFSTSKKKFHRAVDRNRIKRLMREGYRLQKPELYTSLPSGKYFHLALIYTGTEIMTQDNIQKSIVQALDRWVKKYIDIPSPPENGENP